MARRIQWRRAHRQRCYTTTELADVLGVHPNTVRAWRKRGLAPIDEGRPAMFLGAEVQRFGNGERGQRQSTGGPGLIYCVCCRTHRSPKNSEVSFMSHGPQHGALAGACDECGTKLTRFIRIEDIAAFASKLTIGNAGALARLRDGAEAPVNCDFKEE